VSKPVPGTLQICTRCAKHRKHYTQAHGGGWFYCDSFIEAKDIVQCQEGNCHWFSEGGMTHRTPLPGVNQATWLGWTPGPVDSPSSKPLVSNSEMTQKLRVKLKILDEFMPQI
jgi:hypothetical protein